MKNFLSCVALILSNRLWKCKLKKKLDLSTFLTYTFIIIIRSILTIVRGEKTGNDFAPDRGIPRGFQVTKWRVLWWFWTTNSFKNYFDKGLKANRDVLETHITCIESFCIICSKIAIIRNKETRLVMSSQDRRKRSSPRTSSSSSRSTESLSGHSSEKNQHRENSSGRKNNSGKVCT